jgi:A/G-specific adenine glycosylase
MKESKLYCWYNKNKRDLPWRRNKNPYFIWISETMLQQTTTTAVIPFFENFIQKFPTLATLAKAPQEDVIAAWAGLGYYSRARNLHKAAQLLVENGGFQETFEELILYPGFGPYTSRAVSSIAFGQKVGVLDGNVIRVLTRLNNLKTQWWKTKERNQLQDLSDKIAQYKDSASMNQALMELGATICTPKNPSCLLCPVKSECISRKLGSQEDMPLKKPKKDFENYLWKPEVFTKIIENENYVGLVKNDYAPFLKNQWLFPGSISKQKLKPKEFQFKHTITHYQIFVATQKKKITKTSSSLKWVKLADLPKWSPTSLVRKTIDSCKLQ